MDITTKGSRFIFCDWLDLSFPVEECVWAEISDLLSSSGAVLSVFSNGSQEYRFPDLSWGNAQYSSRGNDWQRISFSGGFLGRLRDLDIFSDVLCILGSYVHKVTRLDVTADLPLDGADVVSALRSRYSSGAKVNLTRKGLLPTLILSPRPSDGRETGTFYVGYKTKARVTAKVYDKAYEVFKRTKQIVPPCARFEVTLKTGVGVTLRDAAEPSSVFWHFASPALLSAPPGLSAWVPNRDPLWSGSRPSYSAYQRLERRVDGSAEIDALLDLADECGDDGRLNLLRMLRSRLGLSGVSIPALSAAA